MLSQSLYPRQEHSSLIPRPEQLRRMMGKRAGYTVGNAERTESEDVMKRGDKVEVMEESRRLEMLV